MDKKKTRFIFMTFEGQGAATGRTGEQSLQLTLHGKQSHKKPDRSRGCRWIGDDDPETVDVRVKHEPIRRIGSRLLNWELLWIVAL